jgi:hypothetical protein
LGDEARQEPCDYDYVYTPMMKCVTINKANQEETKPVVIYDYNINMLGTDPNDVIAILAGMEKWY